MNEEKVKELFKAGKQEKAFNMLYKIYPQFKAYVLKQGGDTNNAEDVFQEAILIFYKKISNSNFEFNASLKTYLFNTAKYIWWNLNKKKDCTGLDFDISSDEQEELNVALEKEQKIQQVEKALNELGEKCKSILEAFYYKGLRMKEIAKMFKYSSEKSAKNQKYKCLERARKEIAQH